MRYKNASQRATAAARIFKRNKCLNTRTFSGLFEEGDGDEVKRLLIERATTDADLWAAMERHGYVSHWNMTPRFVAAVLVSLAELMAKSVHDGPTFDRAVAICQRIRAALSSGTVPAREIAQTATIWVSKQKV